MCDHPECGSGDHRERPNSRSRNYSGPFAKTPDRLLGMGLIRLYQLTLSGFIGNSCRHLPTCSEYGYEAVARHGLWTGGFLTLFRVGRCGPFGTSGIDRVPEKLEARYVWWAPWRYFSVGAHRADIEG
ncbi:MAG: membrane protein insertion efficiency factor YidD [Allorhizobium sp.]